MGYPVPFYINKIPKYFYSFVCINMLRWGCSKNCWFYFGLAGRNNR